MGTNNKDTGKTAKVAAKKSTAKPAAKPVSKSIKVTKAPKAEKVIKAPKAAAKPVVAKPAKVPTSTTSNRQDLLDLKAALKAELKAEKAAEAVAYQQVLASAGKVKTDQAPPVEAAGPSKSSATAPAPAAAAITQPTRKPPILRNGVGEMITSSNKPKPQGVHKLRDVIVGLGILLVIAVGIWSAIQYIQYRHLHSPAVQAALFKQYDDETNKLDLMRSYADEVASLNEYLDTKPNQPYLDKATFKQAKALWNLGRSDQAITQFKKVESIPEFQMDARRGLALAYLAKGDKANAHYYQQQVVDALKDKHDADSNLQRTIDEVQLKATNK